MAVLGKIRLAAAKMEAIAEQVEKDGVLSRDSIAVLSELERLLAEVVSILTYLEGEDGIAKLVMIIGDDLGYELPLAKQFEQEEV